MKPDILKLTIKRDQSNFSIVFLLAVRKMAIIVSLSCRLARTVTAARTAGTAAVCKVVRTAKICYKRKKSNRNRPSRLRSE